MITIYKQLRMWTQQSTYQAWVNIVIINTRFEKGENSLSFTHQKLAGYYVKLEVIVRRYRV